MHGMKGEIELPNPKLQHDPLAVFLRHEEGFDFVGEEATPEEVNQARAIEQAAIKIESSIQSLMGENWKGGFVISLTKKAQDFPIFAKQIGTPENLGYASALAKARTSYLKDNPEAIHYDGAFTLPDGWILGVAGLDNTQIESATVLGIAIGAKRLTIDKAEELAVDPKMDCRVFMEKEDAFTLPFLH